VNSERITRILDSGYKAVLVTTGGGSTALNTLLTTPGASRFVADAQIPYSPEALSAYLGEDVEQSCSPLTARKLAEVAFKSQASSLKPLAVSCTAALRGSSSAATARSSRAPSNSSATSRNMPRARRISASRGASSTAAS